MGLELLELRRFEAWVAEREEVERDEVDPCAYACSEWREELRTAN